MQCGKNENKKKKKEKKEQAFRIRLFPSLYKKVGPTRRGQTAFTNRNKLLAQPRVAKFGERKDAAYNAIRSALGATSQDRHEWEVAGGVTER